MKNATKAKGKKLVLNACTLALGAASATAYAADKPNILVIFGDDVGYWNLSTYNQGMMAYNTPNIDTIAQEGAKFYKLLCTAKLNRWPLCLYHWSNA